MSVPDAAVLIVDDDESLRRILARHLSAHGYDVQQAPSAEEAERLLAGNTPNVVILDIGLPAATGWDLLRGPALRRADSPPVVIASALTISPRRLSEFGVAGYLPKPFALETFMDTIERVLQSEAAPSNVD